MAGCTWAATDKRTADLDPARMLAPAPSPPEASLGQPVRGPATCHKALTGNARSLSPNGSVEVPV